MTAEPPQVHTAVAPSGDVAYIDGEFSRKGPVVLEIRSAIRSQALVLAIVVLSPWMVAASTLDPCTITLNPESSNYGSQGGSGFFTVDASIPNCPWGAGTYHPWITITSNPAGYGDGSLSYDVEPGESFRQGTINVGGRATHIVTQNGPPISCWIQQITHTTFYLDYAVLGSVSHDAQWIAYDLNPGGVYLQSLPFANRITVSDGQCYAGNPTTNGTGRFVAYETQCDPTGQNPDGNREIMLFDRIAGLKTQLTQSADFGNFAPRISRAGDLVVFMSSNDLTGGNPETDRQLFIVDVASGEISQLTQLQSSGFSWDVSADGEFVVLSTDEDLVGLNNDQNEEVYHLAIDSGTLTQITRTTDGDNWSPSVSGDGTKVAFFTTSADLGNTTGLPVLMVGDLITGSFVDVPDPAAGSGATSADASGTRIGALQGSTIVVHDLGTLRSQVLATNGLNSGKVQTNGEIVSIRSTADLTGQNPDASIEIFVATCPAPLFADGFVFGSLDLWSRVMGGQPRP